jgi:hypothetical protein
LDVPVIVAGGALSSLDAPPEPALEATKVDAPPPETSIDMSAPLRTRAYIAGGVGGALVLGGVVMLLATDLAPLGGGMIGVGVVGLGLAGFWYYKAETMTPVTKTTETVLLPNVTPDGIGAAVVGRF